MVVLILWLIYLWEMSLLFISSFKTFLRMPRYKKQYWGFNVPLIIMIILCMENAPNTEHTSSFFNLVQNYSCVLEKFYYVEQNNRN